MKQYLLKRLMHGAVVVWLVLTTVFVIIRLIPGDPVDVMLGPEATPETAAALREQLGLQEPIYFQYYYWLSNLATGDFGTSIHRRISVNDLLLGVVEPTVSIGLVAVMFGLSVGIPLGMISALYQDTTRDYLSSFVAFLSLSLPGFWIGIVLVIVFSRVGFFPVFGYTSIGESFIGWLSHVILPALAIGIPYAGFIMRMTRSSFLETLSKDYVQTAKAKGLEPDIIVLKHVFQNALLPVVTLSGILLGAVLGGVVAVEIVFGIQGMGRLLIESIRVRDYPVIQAGVVAISVTFVLINLFIDILYTLINPKIKYE